MAKDRGLPRDVGQRGAGCPRLTIDQILAWADDYRAVTGCWPTRDDGAVMKGAISFSCVW